MIKEQDDMVLIQNILDGNQTAQETLYKRYRKTVKDFILSKYPTYYDIDDDVSEVLIKVFMNIKEFREHKAKFKSWVLSITKNYMIDKWRCTAACNTTVLPANANLTLTSSCAGSYLNSTFTVNNSGISNANGMSVSNCCSFTNVDSTNFENCNAVSFISTQISPVDYALLDMKYVQGYDYKEIGSEFQLTSSTVSNKINYIKTKLKKSLPDDIFE
jgi:DNA-directed RNA polymerase specialized sigma24 family protein